MRPKNLAEGQVTIAEAISLAKELNDMNALAFALFFACWLAQFARHPGEVERLAADLTELSTPKSFAFWLAAGKVFRGWARSASDNTVEGIAWIEQGIADWVATGATLGVPYYLALKAEALYLTNRTSEAVVAIEEAEALAERSEECHWCAELHRLRGVFLAALGAGHVQSRLHFARPSESQKSKSRFR